MNSLLAKLSPLFTKSQRHDLCLNCWPVNKGLWGSRAVDLHISCCPHSASVGHLMKPTICHYAKQDNMLPSHLYSVIWLKMNYNLIVIVKILQRSHFNNTLQSQCLSICLDVIWQSRPLKYALMINISAYMNLRQMPFSLKMWSTSWITRDPYIGCSVLWEFQTKLANSSRNHLSPCEWKINEKRWFK